MTGMLVSKKEAARLARIKERAKKRADKRKAWVYAYMDRRGYTYNRHCAVYDSTVKVGGLRLKVSTRDKAYYIQE